MAQLPGSLTTQTEAIGHVHGLVEAFRAFDSDNNGWINEAELGGILCSLGYNPTEEEVRAMMQEGDQNKDGLMSLDEFLEMNTKNLELQGIGNLLMSAAEALNNNIGCEGFCDQTVSGEELFHVFRSLEVNFSLEDCQNIIASMDMNGDGVVSLEDFNLVVSSLL